MTGGNPGRRRPQRVGVWVVEIPVGTDCGCRVCREAVGELLKTVGRGVGN